MRREHSPSSRRACLAMHLTGAPGFPSPARVGARRRTLSGPSMAAALLAAACVAPAPRGAPPDSPAATSPAAPAPQTAPSSPAAPQTAPSSPAAPSPQTASAAAATIAPPAPTTPAEATLAAPALPAIALPAIALPEKIAVPGDRAVFVAHGAPGDRRALVYLHGRCGDVHAFRGWAPAAARHGTLIALVGDTPCKGGWRSTWSHDIAGLDRRIRAAIAAVGAARGAPLAGESVTLIGYSLGATRAESLAKRSPGRYPRAILIGGPTTPEAASFGGAGAVVVMAGARDRRRHLEDAAAALAAAGIPATFLVLPAAKHGEYGPEGERVLGEALRWVHERAPVSGAPGQ